MATNLNVTGFLKTLEQTPKNFDGGKKSPEEKLVKSVYLSYPGNHGKYQILPVNSTTTGFPFVKLQKTREIKMTRTIPGAEGEEPKSFDSWIKILPASAYEHLDENGRMVSSLTSADHQLLDSVAQSFEMLYEELGGNLRAKDGERQNAANKTVGVMRRRDYTVFYAKCLKHWGLNDMRTPIEENFPGLFVCTSKAFTDTINGNIQDEIADHNGSTEWLNQIYNRELTGRTGYLMFSISMPEGQIGYQISANHKSDSQQVAGYSISQEEMDQMTDPVTGFLGWQTGREKTFNAPLMTETLNYINSKIAAVRAEKSVGMDAMAARAASNATARASEGRAWGGSKDPMLENTERPYLSNPGALYDSNDSPWETPPAAHIDPTDGGMVPGGSGNFGARFNNGGGSMPWDR